MKVKLLVGLSGPAFALQPGDIYECGGDEAWRMISSRFAVPYTEKELEKAVVEPVTEQRETAAKKPAAKPRAATKSRRKK